MADEKSGVGRLRYAAGQTEVSTCRICEAVGVGCEYGEGCNDARGRALWLIADQIEREHAAELAAAKRDMTDEAREAVERLLAVDAGGIYGSESMGNAMCRAVIGRDDGEETWRESFGKLRDRLIELIGHGGKPDAEREAAADWVEAQGGYDVVRDYPRMDEFVASLANELGVSDDVGCGDDLRDAVSAELDKRLMPQGCEWPRFEDGERVAIGGEAQDNSGDTAVVSAVRFRKGGTDVIFDMDCRAGTLLLSPGERVKRHGTDAQERIDEAKSKGASDYWGCLFYGCDGCPSLIDGKTPREHYGVRNCDVAQGMDIARREHELRAKTMGGDAS